MPATVRPLSSTIGLANPGRFSAAIALSSASTALELKAWAWRPVPPAENTKAITSRAPWTRNGMFIVFPPLISYS
jgi:hypothetical protein